VAGHLTGGGTTAGPWRYYWPGLDVGLLEIERKLGRTRELPERERSMGRTREVAACTSLDLLLTGRPSLQWDA
jgi:hypothetical protein